VDPIANLDKVEKVKFPGSARNKTSSFKS